MYTAVPAAAIKAPITHMSKVTPTLPAERRIMPGVAKILEIHHHGVSGASSSLQAWNIHPVPTVRLNIKKMTLTMPTRPTISKLYQGWRSALTELPLRLRHIIMKLYACNYTSAHMRCCR